MIDRKKVEETIRAEGYDDFKWISGDRVVVSQWVRFKCMYGCDSYGRKGGCPPETPPVAECRELFKEYSDIAVLHFEKSLENPDERRAWSWEINKKLLGLERAVFTAGYQKALILFMDECRGCAECTGSRVTCRNPEFLRPGPEALAMDVFSTVRSVGYPIEVLSDYDKTMNRYAFLLVD